MPLHTVDAPTLHRWLANNEAVLIDVREASEHAEKNIPAAVSIPLGTLSENTIPETADKKLVLHCGGGGRAGRACEKLLSENPDLEVYNLTGGLRGWSAAGFEVNEGQGDGEGKNFCMTKK